MLWLTLVFISNDFEISPAFVKKMISSHFVRFCASKSYAISTGVLLQKQSFIVYKFLLRIDALYILSKIMATSYVLSKVSGRVAFDG